MPTASGGALLRPAPAAFAASQREGVLGGCFDHVGDRIDRFTGDAVYRGVRQAAALTWRNEGLVGFYRGLGPALIRVLPQSALTLTVYEKVLQIIP